LLDELHGLAPGGCSPGTRSTGHVAIAEGRRLGLS
jgi:hypothetical protein